MTETLPWPIQDIAAWMPFWKGAGFFLATFILEDLAAVGAGLLLAAGAISWPVAFASCFMGIWLGDAGLYALARFGGRHWFERSSLKKFSEKVARSESWFARRGALILIFSRCIPGARLPTYLAAGFLRLALPRFLSVTGAAAFLWTIVILWLAQTLGARAIHLLNTYQHGALLMAGLGLFLFATFQWLRRLFERFDARVFRLKIERWRHWEFWPAWAFYPPVAIYCLWLMVKFRGISLPTTANPGIFSGGLVGESKFAMLKTLMATSPEFTADAAVITGDSLGARKQSLELMRAELKLELPFILKPDLGQRGAGIKLVRTLDQADDYLRQMPGPIIVQRYAPGPFEIGVFYYRFPNQTQGRIFAITEKTFPLVVGDGHATIGGLIERNPRARLISDIYKRRFATRWNEILPTGQTLKLVQAGNHAQGCIFHDGQRLGSPALEARIDAISKKIDGFFIGRYDIRFEHEDELTAGRNFQIIELNGAASEATSIYDARNSLWSAYRTLFRQWELVFAIGAANRKRGFAPTSALAIWKTWRSYLRLAATYPAAD